MYCFLFGISEICLTLVCPFAGKSRCFSNKKTFSHRPLYQTKIELGDFCRVGLFAKPSEIFKILQTVFTVLYTIFCD